VQEGARVGSEGRGAREGNQQRRGRGKQFGDETSVASRLIRARLRVLSRVIVFAVGRQDTEHESARITSNNLPSTQCQQSPAEVGLEQQDDIMLSVQNSALFQKHGYNNNCKYS
jgi:hypothetical protein